MPRKKLLNRLFNTDSRKLGAVIRRPLVDVVITSPPYADLKDYGSTNQIGHGQDYEKEYLPALKDVFQQCFDVTKETGSMWIVVDSFRKGGEVEMLPFKLAALCQEIGWKWSDVIIWDKGKTLPWSHKGRLRKIFEYVLFFTKSPRHKYYIDRIKDPDSLKEWWVKYPERYALKGKVPANIWSIPIPVQGSWAPNPIKHACPFPPQLVERMLLLTTDKKDLVLDPFSGSGVVLAQALCMGRRYIGFELNPDYVERFKNNVLPSIRKRSEAARKEMLQAERRSKEFEGKLRKLRLLKYPKAILKALRSKSENDLKGIVCALVSEDGKQPDKNLKRSQFAAATVTFLLDQELDVERVRKLVDAAAKTPPVSKFGISPTFNILKADSFFSNKDHLASMNGHPFYVYIGGKTHHYHEEVTMTDLSAKLSWGGWRNLKKDNLPPVVSEIGIRQPIVRTWKSKEERLEEDE